jgi:hypothetical protein
MDNASVVKGGRHQAEDDFGFASQRGHLGHCCKWKVRPRLKSRQAAKGGFNQILKDGRNRARHGPWEYNWKDRHGKKRLRRECNQTLMDHGQEG